MNFISKDRQVYEKMSAQSMQENKENTICDLYSVMLLKFKFYRNAKFRGHLCMRFFEAYPLL